MGQSVNVYIRNGSRQRCREPFRSDRTCSLTPPYEALIKRKKTVSGAVSPRPCAGGHYPHRSEDQLELARRTPVAFRPVVRLGYTKSTSITSLRNTVSPRDDNSSTHCFRAKHFLSDDTRYLSG